MVKEVVAYLDSSTPPQVRLNNPASWYWNVRVGDKLQINGAGLWYTVVGPMKVTPAQGNFEQFVNVGLPGSSSLLSDSGQCPVTVNPEFLLLVNGLDDAPKNGWIDEGYDGFDNNGNGSFDERIEWENEAWPAAVAVTNGVRQNYTIQRRPTPVGNAREISLPTNVVVDLTSWGNIRERSRFPAGVVNPFAGYVDILLYPNGTVVPTTIYSTPSSFGMSGAFFHFWLAERSDVVSIQRDPNNSNQPQSIVTGQPVFLPIGDIKQQLISTTNPYTGPSLQGEYRIVSLFTRTGQVTGDDHVQFDNPVSPINGTYNPGYPFLAIEQGTKGGR
jgi:hypothetical protein